MGAIIGFDENDFRKNLLGVFKLYDTYISREDIERYVSRTHHLVRDWGKATEALQSAVFKNNSIPDPSDLARFAQMRHSEPRTTNRYHGSVFDEDPRARIVEALRANSFRDIYTELKNEKKAGGWIRSVCPIHKGKKQSFGYSLESGIWKCFSRCGTGSLFDYEMAMTGESYSEVLHRLAYDLGIEFTMNDTSRDKMTFKEEI